VAPQVRFVAQPGMSSLAKAFAVGLDVRLSAQVVALARGADGWRLRFTDGAEAGPFASVVVATPAEQAAPLLETHAPVLAGEAHAEVTAPCWAGLYALVPPNPIPFTALKLADHPILSWIACDSAKPGRGGELVCWVVHARADWSRSNLEASPEDVARQLATALAGFMDSAQTPIFAQAHRWRFAFVERPGATPFVWDPGPGLGVCSDWRIGPRVEAAFLSGHALADAMLR
jgi:renalase